MTQRKSFGSDNHAGAHPAVLEALAAASRGDATAYGDDPWTARASAQLAEAFGDLKWNGPSCMVPADYLLAVGFKTVRQHARYPRLRLELKTALSWREDVEVALERLLGSMTPERALRLA